MKSLRGGGSARGIVRGGSRSRITFEAQTADHRNTKYVGFEISSRKTWAEYSSPYAYFGNKRKAYNFWPSPIYNRWFQLTVRGQVGARKQVTRVQIHLHPNM